MYQINRLPAKRRSNEVLRRRFWLKASTTKSIVDRGKSPLDGRFMGLDFVDLFFNHNLPGFHSFKYGDDFIEFFVGSHNSFISSCTQVPNA